MVEIHHGSIKVDSQPGVGSRFTVTLPLQKQAFEKDTQAEFILNDAQSSSPTATDEDTKGTDAKETYDNNTTDCHSILVVEDNK